MKRLEGKVAIVTGSTSGIGTGIAALFAQEGASVVVCGRRQEKGQQVVDSITGKGGIASYHHLDITLPESIQQLMDDTAREYGKIDILVNNAANVGLKDGSVSELTMEMWDAIMASDLRSVFLATKAVLPYMRKAEGGSIINIGSTASVAGDLGATAYASAKAGVELLTQSTSLQYGKENIRCNCIRPGFIMTPDNESKIVPLMKDIFLKNIEVNRVGRPEDIAHLALYLASDESSYTTGQIMTVDGGLNAHVATVAQFRDAGSRTW